MFTPLPDDCLLKKSEEELNTLSEELVSLLSTKEFSVNDFKIILSKCKNTPFDIVTLFLSKQVKEYQSCLDLLLDTFSRIPNKEITLFSWLEMTLLHLKKNIKVNLQVGSGTSWGHLLTVDSLVHLCQELVNVGSSRTLTVGSANLEKLASVYVKLTVPEAEDTTGKLPCVVCESTDEGAMLIEDYIALKHWQLA